MNICEGCIKQDVCRFREDVARYEKTLFCIETISLEPLEVTCKYKQNGGCDSITVSPFPNSTTGTTLFRNDMPWTYTYKRA